MAENKAGKIKLKTFHSNPKMRSKGYWEILVSIAFILLFFIFQIIFAGIVHVLIGPENASLDQLANPQSLDSAALSLHSMSTFTGIFVSGIFFLITTSTYLIFYGRYKTLKLDHWGKNLNLRILGACIVLIFIAMIFQAVYRSALPDIEMQKAVNLLIGAMPDTFYGKLILFLSVGLMAGITEEIIFRGMLQNALNRYLNIHVAIIISGVLFAMVHGQFYALPALAALGIAFGYVYHLTGSLRVAITLHVINNSLALILSEFAPEAETTEKATAFITPFIF